MIGGPQTVLSDYLSMECWLTLVFIYGEWREIDPLDGVVYLDAGVFVLDAGCCGAELLGCWRWRSPSLTHNCTSMHTMLQATKCHSSLTIYLAIEPVSI